jgi:hypothetical protein
VTYLLLHHGEAALQRRHEELGARAFAQLSRCPRASARRLSQQQGPAGNSRPDIEAVRSREPGCGTFLLYVPPGAFDLAF